MRVAVKWLNPKKVVELDEKEDEVDGIMAELETLGQIDNVNWVRLLAYCVENPTDCSFTSYMSNGTLYGSLFKHVESWGNDVTLNQGGCK